MAKFVKVMEWIAKDNLLEFVEVFQPADPCYEAVACVHDKSYINKLIQGSIPPNEMRKTGFQWSEGLVKRCFREVGMLWCLPTIYLVIVFSIIILTGYFSNQHNNIIILENLVEISTLFF